MSISIILLIMEMHQPFKYEDSKHTKNSRWSRNKGFLRAVSELHDVSLTLELGDHCPSFLIVS